MAGLLAEEAARSLGSQGGGPEPQGGVPVPQGGVPVNDWLQVGASDMRRHWSEDAEGAGSMERRTIRRSTRRTRGRYVPSPCAHFVRLQWVFVDGPGNVSMR